jgi:large subunit ribosomal protein L31
VAVVSVLSTGWISAAGPDSQTPERAKCARDLDWVAMKAGIHPEYTLANVHCSCGNQFYTRSTESDLHVELCSECHPFYTGKQKLVDTGGRVERFQRRAAKHAKASR